MLNRYIAEKLAYNRRNTPQLNPLLFEDDELKPEIKEKVLQIVDAFFEYAQVDVHTLDIRLVGSNAAYNYHEGSDLDIHIVVDLSKISDPDTIARLYFDSVKKNFKDSYDITIRGIEVEIYVEDVNSSANSNGIYSVTHDKWIKEPTPSIEPTEEEVAEAESIEEEVLDDIEDANTIEELESVVDELYLIRKDSLATHGETGAGNLAFKSLRNKGILDKIKDTIRKDTSRELSLESRKVRESISPFKVGNTYYQRDKRYGVGKRVGNQVYFHKNYAEDIVPGLYDRAKDILEEEYPDFEYNCLMYDTSKPNILRFDEAPDFDTAREPIPGNMISVNTETGECIERYSPQIWHHKWMWVKDDYKGFDVQSSYDWSRTWTQKLTKPSGYRDKWEDSLRDKGLE